jgi:hypothetical protein
MRLIDADALMKALNDLFLMKSPIKYDDKKIAFGRAAMCRGIDDCIYYVREAPTVNDWISVKDRLPETNDEVLTTYIYADKPGKRYVEAASYWDDGEGEGHWCSVWDEYRVGNARKTVIAWMTMPRPYKPEVDSDGEKEET